ncbi:hypothetical protein [Aureimonas leprariae]|uniref:Alkaline proteinase inhibitor/ Outer membrane lipoprotein Omp19 domain-containing protein n=1 Tax=Plantimonas leprariae TaxID=2615207 RepID=A0A7V7PM78_9HYPH|nr:hypothetical protein [Aureimonas leprariae]KAB0677989.1 hypothetical protein F6X38_16280 [Aureimonas leprariae]
MNFAAITAGVGLVGTLLAASLQGGPAFSGDLAASGIVDPMTTGGIAAAASAPRDASGDIRLIDLKAGATCRTEAPPADGGLKAAPLGTDCAKSPSLSRIAYWRSEPDGSLVMADAGGRKVLEFAPGDGVMYESVYPSNELITIVPARG